MSVTNEYNDTSEIEQLLASVKAGDTYGAWTITGVRSRVVPWSGITAYEIDLRCACGTERTRKDLPVFTSQHCNHCRTGMFQRECSKCARTVLTNDPEFSICSTCQRLNNTRYCVNCNEEIYPALWSRNVCQRCTEGERRYTCPVCHLHWTVNGSGTGGVYDDQLCRFCERILDDSFWLNLGKILRPITLALAA